MAGNPLLWREQAAVADMHCRLAAKKLNQVMMTDGIQAEKLIAELGKALECVQAATSAIAAARTTVEMQNRRPVFCRGVRVPQFGGGATIHEIVEAKK